MSYSWCNKNNYTILGIRTKKASSTPSKRRFEHGLNPNSTRVGRSRTAETRIARWVTSELTNHFRSWVEVSCKCVSELTTRVGNVAPVWTLNPDSSELEVMSVHVYIPKVPLSRTILLSKNLTTKHSSSNRLFFRNVCTTLSFLD